MVNKIYIYFLLYLCYLPQNMATHRHRVKEPGNLPVSSTLHIPVSSSKKIYIARESLAPTQKTNAYLICTFGLNFSKIFLAFCSS